MSRRTFIFADTPAADADLTDLIEQALAQQFTHEEGSDPYIRADTVAVYVGGHEFGYDDIAWPGGPDIPLHSLYPAMIEIRDTGHDHSRQREIADKVFAALRSAGRRRIVYIDDMQKVLDSYAPHDPWYVHGAPLMAIWWRAEAYLERARLLLSAPADEALDWYSEFLEHNELGLALGELANVAAAQQAPRAAWKELASAAIVMRPAHADAVYEAAVSRIREHLGESGQETSIGEFYWKRYPDGPFATLIRIATTYLHPEADDLESLQRLAKRENDKEVHAFKAELREALKDPNQLPDGELPKHVRYEDGSSEALLRRLWRDLYGDEPVGNPET